MKNSKAAFKWIVGILKKRGIQFQVVGGLAAITYGAKRPVVDIDLQIPSSGFEKILGDVNNYKVLGPGQYRDRVWNLRILTLNYEGQIIDLGDSNNTKFYNHRAQLWEKLSTNYSNSEIKEIYGIKVPVIPKQQLIQYKTKLGRPVDEIDIVQITNVN